MKSDSLGLKLRIALSKLKTFLLMLIDLNLSLFLPIKKHPYIKHLSFNILSSIYEMVENRYLSKRIEEGYYKDKFVFINSIPHSGSKMFSTIIADLYMSQYGSLKFHRRYSRYMLTDTSLTDYDLRFDMLRDFPYRGQLRTHSLPSPKNLMIIKKLGVRTILVFRHPLDGLTAWHCGNKEKASWEINKGSQWFFDDVMPFDSTNFDESLSLEESINRFISSGYLAASLSWMATWAKFRETESSTIVRFEDVKKRPNKTCLEAFKFLTGEDGDESKIPSSDFLEKPDLVNKTYPHGYAGRVGIWRSYFTEKNKKLYDEVINSWKSNNDTAKYLEEVYPSLLETDYLETLTEI